MHDLPGFVHGRFPALLHAAGFREVTVEDVSERMLPMLRRLSQVFGAPYQLSRLLRLQRRLVNALAAVEAYRHQEVWRYNIVTAGKPH
jgi:sterol 24-C-methyltransferase